MRCTPAKIPGAHLIEAKRFDDQRGFFSPLFENRLFKERGLCSNFHRLNSSLSLEKGTLRGMHYQLPPHREVKLIKVIRGAIWDVILDLRQDSPQFGEHEGYVLTAENRKMLYIPEGCAHGFITLAADTEVLYLASEHYQPTHERGVRWDDPQFKIQWPEMPTVISEKDRLSPNFDPRHHLEIESKSINKGVS